MRKCLDSLISSIVRTSLGVVVTLLLESCAQQQTSATVEDDPFKFFNVVYGAKSTRENKSTPWYPIQGAFQAQFNMSQDQTSGTFTFYYNKYCEPQFAIYGQTCDCSGTATGTFTVQYGDQTTSGGSSSSGTSGSYNPSNPYSTPSSDLTDLEGVAKVNSYLFSVVFTGGSMIGYCRPGDAPRSITIARFVSGEVVAFDSFRMIFFQPQIVAQ